MNPIQSLLDEAVALHKHGDLPNAAIRYNQILNLEPDNAGVLFLMGDIAVRQSCNGLAINLLRNAVKLQPMAQAYIALGVAYKNENMDGPACAAWETANKLEPTAEAFNNLASIYSDCGRPEKALGYIQQAINLTLGVPPNNVLWNRALAHLTAQNWRAGWEDHEARFAPEVQMMSTRRNFGCPLWDGTPGKRIAVHGEQGVGDEIMFLSMLPDLLKVCPDAVIEVEPRLMDLVERSFGVTTYGNENAMKAHEKPFQATVALGSLGGFFRNRTEDFPGTAYLKADPERVEYWRRQFAMQGKRPFVGVAWQGGTKATRIVKRSINAHMLKFCKRGTAISLQYGEYAEQEAKAAGFVFYPESVGKDLDDMAAMVEACDVVVTTCQTLVHIAGALGKPAIVLTPKYSSWRYGMGDTMPWYKSVTLYRQEKEDDWSKPLEMAKQAFDAYCRSFQNADQ